MVGLGVAAVAADETGVVAVAVAADETGVVAVVVAADETVVREMDAAGIAAQREAWR